MQRKTTGGRVVAVGPSGHRWKEVTMQVKVGEKVISKYSGTEVKLDGKVHHSKTRRYSSRCRII